MIGIKPYLKHILPVSDPAEIKSFSSIAEKKNGRIFFQINLTLIFYP